MTQRVRSPRYPSLSLSEAESLARKLYQGDGMNAVDREVAAKHMGYNSMNGASAQALGSVAQYGFIENAGKGQTRLTELSLDVLEPQDEDGRRMALEQAAFTPTLFAALRERFPNTIPSEGALRAHLIRTQYTPAAIRSIVPAYLATCEYVSAGRASETSSSEHPNTAASRGHQQEMASQTEASINRSVKVQVPASVPPSIPEPKREGIWRDVFELEEGEVIISLPSKMSAESIADVEQWLMLITRKVRRASGVPSASANTASLEAKKTDPLSQFGIPDK